MIIVDYILDSTHLLFKVTFSLIKTGNIHAKNLFPRRFSGYTQFDIIQYTFLYSETLLREESMSTVSTH